MQLKTYLLERHCASLTEIARHLATEPDAVRPMLERWTAKGRVRRLTAARCHGCASCSGADLEFYEWVDPVGSEHVD